MQRVCYVIDANREGKMKDDFIERLLSRPSFVRRMIKLEPGEKQPTYALDDPPEGYRWETDAELRERISDELAKKASDL